MIYHTSAFHSDILLLTFRDLFRVLIGMTLQASALKVKRKRILCTRKQLEAEIHKEMYYY